MINENKIPSSYSVKEKIVHGELKKLLGGLAFTTYDVRAGSLEALFKKGCRGREPGAALSRRELVGLSRGYARIS